MKMRAMVVDDLPALMDIQEAGAVVALASVFPQDRYPFPRAAVQARWSNEITDPGIGTYVAIDAEGSIEGFAATSAGELLHFGTTVGSWGSGAATELLGAIVAVLREDTPEPTLRVFAENRRARRFYEKHGWRPTGETSVSDFEPHPLLLHYSLPRSD